MTTARPTPHTAPPSWRGAYLRLINTLARRRVAAGLRQEDLAAQLGIGIATLKRWEGGHTAPGAEDLFQWAAVLGVEVSFMIREVAP